MAHFPTTIGFDSIRRVKDIGGDEGFSDLQISEVAVG